MTTPLAPKTGVRARVRETVRTEVHRVDFGLRVIIVVKIIKATLLLALGIAAFALVHSDLARLAARLIAWCGIDAGRPTVQHVLVKLAGLSAKRISVIGAGLIVYASVNAVEAWGLHRRRTWAEWLTVIVTCSLIPLEIYELVTHPSPGKVIALVVNIVIVLYLLRHKWLFTRNG